MANVTTIDQLEVGTRVFFCNKQGIANYGYDRTYILTHKNRLNTIFEFDRVENDTERKIISLHNGQTKPGISKYVVVLP